MCALVSTPRHTVLMGTDVPPADRATLRHAPPTESAVKELYVTALACGIPRCGEPLYPENPPTGQRLLNSRIAHIHARSSGPRWDPAMSEKANRSFGNLIVRLHAGARARSWAVHGHTARRQGGDLRHAAGGQERLPLERRALAIKLPDVVDTFRVSYP